MASSKIKIAAQKTRKMYIKIGKELCTLEYSQHCENRKRYLSTNDNRQKKTRVCCIKQQTLSYFLINLGRINSR